MERQALNVFRMRLMGAEVRPVHSGTATLKDATSEAIRDWVTNVETTHYILGSAAGPHPYPMMVSGVEAVWKLGQARGDVEVCVRLGHAQERRQCSICWQHWSIMNVGAHQGVCFV